MAFTKLTKDMAIIQKLDDEPNDVGGLTAAQLKAKFDEAGESVKDFINNTFLPEAQDALNGALLGQVPEGLVSGANLLDNWYFADPINQRGEQSYAGEGHTIDRWMSQSDGPLALVPGEGITLMDGAALAQRVPGLSAYTGRTLTFSVLTADGAVLSASAHLPQMAMAENSKGLSVELTHDSANDWIEVSFGFRVPDNALPDGCTVLAAKLELGSVQTLAVQENGVWVLREALPRKGEELAKCQRCQYVTSWANGAYLTGYGFTMDATRARVFLPVPVTLRATPALSDTAGSNWGLRVGGTTVTPTAVSVFGYGAGTVILTFTGTFSEGNLPVVAVPASSTKVVFDANL